MPRPNLLSRITLPLDAAGSSAMDESSMCKRTYVEVTERLSDLVNPHSSISFPSLASLVLLCFFIPELIIHIIQSSFYLKFARIHQDRNCLPQYSIIIPLSLLRLPCAGHLRLEDASSLHLERKLHHPLPYNCKARSPDSRALVLIGILTKSQA